MICVICVEPENAERKHGPRGKCVFHFPEKCTRQVIVCNLFNIVVFSICCVVYHRQTAGANEMCVMYRQTLAKYTQQYTRSENADDARGMYLKSQTKIVRSICFILIVYLLRILGVSSIFLYCRFHFIFIVCRRFAIMANASFCAFALPFFLFPPLSLSLSILLVHTHVVRSYTFLGSHSTASYIHASAEITHIAINVCSCMCFYSMSPCEGFSFRLAIENSKNSMNALCGENASVSLVQLSLAFTYSFSPTKSHTSNKKANVRTEPK